MPARTRASWPRRWHQAPADPPTPVLPLSDLLRARSFPFVNVALIVANFLVWILYEIPNPESSVDRWSFYPCAVVTVRPHVAEPWLLTWFTAMFMHASRYHILGQQLFLAIFGKNVEDAYGHLRYLVLYLAGGFVAMADANRDDLAGGLDRVTLRCRTWAPVVRSLRARRLPRAVPDVARPRPGSWCGW